MYTEHDANEVRMGLASTGQIAIDIFSGNSTCFWPRDTQNNYIFASGLWLGGIADVDGDGEEEMFGVQTYDPLSGGSECAPGRFSDDPEDTLSRLYVSTNPADLAQWPEEFEDESGAPLVHSLQDIVGIYNDINGTPLFALGPAGIQIEQRSMAFAIGRTAQVIIFIWDLTNASAHHPYGPYTMNDAYIGVEIDVDIGDEYADDRTSFFTYQVTDNGDSIPINMAFAWDEDFDERNFQGAPGFVGMKFLLTPGNDEDGMDNDHDGYIDESPYNEIDDDGDGEIDEWDEVDELGLVNYTFHCGPSTCEIRPDPETDAELYRILSCSPLEECVETTESTDIRFMMSSGPFWWPEGRTIRVATAYVFALQTGDPQPVEVYGNPPRPDPNDPVFSDFIAVALDAQSLFNAGFPDSLGYFHIFTTTYLELSNRMTSPQEIGTSILSSEGVADAKLFYSFDGGETFSTDEMQHVEGDRYVGHIPPTNEWWKEVLYFIQGIDSTYQVVRDPKNAPEDVFDYLVVPTPDFFPPDSVTGINETSPNILTLIDYDNDTDLDPYFYHNGQTHLYRNDGERTFEDVTDITGTGLSGYSKATTGDFNNDGYDDLLVGGGNRQMRLFQNLENGTFEEVSSRVGLTETLSVVDFVWSDVDRDGYLDIIVMGSSEPRLFTNVDGQSFIDETYRSGIQPASQIRNLVTFDADGDSDEDLLVAAFPSQFYENIGDKFRNRTGASGLGISMYYAAAFDADFDTDLDILCKDRDFNLRIFENDGSLHFTDVSEEYGISDFHSAGPVGDMNADGYPDIIARENEETYLIMRPDGKYIDATDFFDEIGYSTALCLADIDGNGLLDIFKKGVRISAGFPGGYNNNWLELDLEGTVSNRSGVGSVTRLYTGGRILTEFVSGNRLKARRIHYGLEKENPDSLIIHWPSGIVQVERELPVNQIITFIEDSTLVGTGRDDPAVKLPTTYALYQNFPNPFNPTTTIAFDIPGETGAKQHVFIDVYDLRGRLVRILIDEELESGNHSVVWDGRNETGLSVSSGIYLYTLRVGNTTFTRKMTILK